jgi:hypothetical protein
MAKKKLVKAFISIGKIKNANNVETEEFLTVPEELAKFMGAKYSTTPPQPKTITPKKGKLAGRSYKVEHSVSLTGRPYKVGYLIAGGKDSKGKNKAKIKWISIYAPYSLNTREFVEKVIRKLSKKPAYLKTPNGVSVALQLTK